MGLEENVKSNVIIFGNLDNMTIGQKTTIEKTNAIIEIFSKNLDWALSGNQLHTKQKELIKEEFENKNNKIIKDIFEKNLEIEDTEKLVKNNLFDTIEKVHDLRARIFQKPQQDNDRELENKNRNEILEIEADNDEKRDREYREYQQDNDRELEDRNRNEILEIEADNDEKRDREYQEINSNPFLGYTKDQKKIHDRYNSHLNEHSDVINILPELLSKITTNNEEFIIQTIDLERIIGNTTCVKTTQKDIDGGNIVFETREGRNGPTRFVKNRIAEPTQKGTIILKRKNEEEYILITARIGEKAEPEIWDENAFLKSNSYEEAKKKSQAFWETHALIWEE